MVAIDKVSIEDHSKLAVGDLVYVSVMYNPVLRRLMIRHENLESQGAADLLRAAINQLEVTNGVTY